MCACTLKKWQQYMRMSTLDILIVFRTYFYTCTFIVCGDRREKILTIFFQSEECWQHENSLIRLRKALNVVTPRRKVAHNRSCKQKISPDQWFYQWFEDFAGQNNRQPFSRVPHSLYLFYALPYVAVTWSKYFTDERFGDNFDQSSVPK